jgi:hypothetical protein
MSLETLLDAWKWSPLKQSRLLLVLALSDAADDEGWSSPKVDWLAERARVKPRQAQRILRDLEADGTLEVRPGSGRGRTSSYRLRPENQAGKGDTHVTLSPGKGGAEDTLSAEKGGGHDTLFPQKGDTQDTLSARKGVAGDTLYPRKGDMDDTLFPKKGGVDDTLSPPSDSPLTPTHPDDDHRDRRLAPQQETVRRAQEIYTSIGASPPEPGVLKLWANTLGGPDPLCELLKDLAGAGHLASKSQGYVWKAVQNRRRGSSRPAAGVDERRRQQAAALARGGRAS